mgnify:CR=1 FL=1
MATIGDGGAPSQNTINYDALLTTTLFKYRPTMVDNIFKDSVFLASLREMGGVEMQNGGERIAQPLMYGTNNTVKSYANYQTLDTTPQEGISHVVPLKSCEFRGSPERTILNQAA